MSTLQHPRTPLRGHWLLVARLAWVAIASIALGIAVIGLVLSAQQPELAGPDVVVRAWAQVGVPLHVRLFGLLVPTLLAYSATGFVLFWRRSDDWVAMLFGLALVTFGAVVSQYTFAFERAYPSIPGPGFVTNLGCLLNVICLVRLSRRSHRARLDAPSGALLARVAGIP